MDVSAPPSSVIVTQPKVVDKGKGKEKAATSAQDNVAVGGPSAHVASGEAVDERVKKKKEKKKAIEGTELAKPAEPTKTFDSDAKKAAPTKEVAKLSKDAKKKVITVLSDDDMSVAQEESQSDHKRKSRPSEAPNSNASERGGSSTTVDKVTPHSQQELEY